MISEWCKHRDEPAVPICQGKDAEPVEDVGSIGDGRKQPVKVVLVNALREEGNDSEKCSGVRTKVLEHGGGEGKFDRSCETFVALCLQHPRSLSFPFSRQPARVPSVLTRNCGEQGD